MVRVFAAAALGGAAILCVRSYACTGLIIARRPFPTFIAKTLAKFPDAGVCTVEEARVLNEEGGYTFLDVRSKTEFEYKITGSVNVPLINATWKFDSVAKRKVPQQTVNADFVKQVQAKFKPDAKLIVTCSDGRIRSMAALSALDDAGFTNIVGMRQGYNGFSRVFDSKFARRVAPDAMKEARRSARWHACTKAGISRSSRHSAAAPTLAPPLLNRWMRRISWINRRVSTARAQPSSASTLCHGCL